MEHGLLLGLVKVAGCSTMAVNWCRILSWIASGQLTLSSYASYTSTLMKYHVRAKKLWRNFDANRYLDQLGMASKYNTKVFCRQTLIGGNYGLLDTETFLPNPDYYRQVSHLWTFSRWLLQCFLEHGSYVLTTPFVLSALLWHRLMGTGVLSVDINAPRKLRAYAHCRKRHVCIPNLNLLG
jgi:hypothetical protein